MTTKPYKTILKNGMTLLLIESHQSPVVAFNACFRVGSIVEKGAEAGICHFIEHMIFKGTPSHPAGELASIIEGSGGEINAYTSFDETVYYCTVSSRYFDDGLNVLADAILNPLFEEEEIAREKPVVIEEINRSEDNPGKVLSEALFKMAFEKHPYGLPIIGTRKTVMAYTRQQILDFFKRWYVPQNLVFVAAGDFSIAEAEKKIERAFANFKNTPPALQIPEEPEQKKPHFLKVTKKIEGYYGQIAFPISNLASPDLPALDILSHLLGEGLSSRLERRIKEEQGLVTSIYSYSYTPKYPGLLVVGFTCSKGKLEKATDQILKEIFHLKNDSISHAELSRAKLNIKSDAWYERETVEGLSRKYGYFETTLNDYTFDRRYYQQIDEVDPETIHAVASKFIKPERLNQVVLVPENQKLSIKPYRPLKTVKPSQKLTKTQETPTIFRLKNGATLICKEASHLPLVAVRLCNLGGLRSETHKNNGVNHLLAQVMTKGTNTLTAAKLATEIEQIGASIDAFSGRNLQGLQGDFLSHELKDGMNLFFDIFLNPAFDKAEIEKERAITLEAIRREQDQPASIAYKRFFSKLYKTHPYGMSILGSRETLLKLKREDLKRAHQQLLDPKNLVMSVVGDFDTEEMKEWFSEKINSLRSSQKKSTQYSDPKPPSAPITVFEKSSKMQTHIVLGFLGTKIKNNDRHAMDVMNHILAGQGGDFFLELRDKQSLAYSVTSVSQEGVERGFFSVYIATEPSKKEKAIEGILIELEKIRSQKVTATELERAKKYLIGSYELDLQKNSNVANQLTFQQIYGLGTDHLKKLPEKIGKVTQKEVTEVAKRYLDPKHYVLSIVGES